MKPKEIPDSLLQKFSTKNGRTVIDGRGIEPDIKIKDAVYTTYVQGLIAKNLIFYFVNQFVYKHEQIDNEKEFNLSDVDMKDFKAFILSKNFVANTPDQRLFTSLKTELSKSENYNQLKAEMELLEQKLQEIHNNDFDKNYNDIKELLEQEIIGRYYYEKGQITRSFRTDQNLQEGIKVLNEISSYNKILKIN